MRAASDLPASTSLFPSANALSASASLVAAAAASANLPDCTRSCTEPGSVLSVPTDCPVLSPDSFSSLEILLPPPAIPMGVGRCFSGGGGGGGGAGRRPSGYCGDVVPSSPLAEPASCPNAEVLIATTTTRIRKQTRVKVEPLRSGTPLLELYTTVQRRIKTLATRTKSLCCVPYAEWSNRFGIVLARTARNESSPPRISVPQRNGSEPFGPRRSTALYSACRNDPHHSRAEKMVRQNQQRIAH